LGILGAGGYFYYIYAYNNPDKIWEKFIAQPQNEIYQNDFKISYADLGELSKKNDSLGQMGINLKDLKIPESQTSELNEIKNKGKFSLITSKKEFYFKTDFLGDKWQKVDLNTLAVPEKTSQKNNGFANMSGALLYTDSIEKTSSFSDLGNYIKTAKKLKDEKVRGESSYHYVLELDMVKVLETSEEFKSLPDFQKEVYKNLLSKYINMKMDFWVAKKNLLLNKYSVDFDMKFNMEDFGSSGIFKLKFAVSEDIKDIGKPVTIEKPKDAVDFDMNSFMNLMGGTGNVPGGGDILKLAQIKERDARRKADLKQIKAALEQYADDSKGEYPASNDDSKDGVFLPVLKEKNYMAKVPVDPLNPTYYYKYVTDGKSYALTCVLENKDDPEGKKSGDFNIYTLTNK